MLKTVFVLLCSIILCLSIPLNVQDKISQPDLWHPTNVPISTVRVLKQVEDKLLQRGLSISRILSQEDRAGRLIVKVLMRSDEHGLHTANVHVDRHSNPPQLINVDTLSSPRFEGKKLNDTGFGQVEKLIDLMKGDQCDRSLLGLCKKGSLQIDPWLLKTMRTQRMLSYDLPLNYFPFLATHNSFNNRADGYGEYNFDLVINRLLKTIFSGEDFTWIYAQQEYTMTDQLRMGIRALHLDPHWVYGDVRLCHSGAEIGFVDMLAKEYFNYFNETMDWNSQNLFCSPWDRTWSDGLKEIKEWLDLPENSQEFIFIHHDDQKYWTWGRSKLVEDPIKEIFGSTLFTPSDLLNDFRGNWPTVNQLLSKNKRILFQSEDTYGSYDQSLIFAPFLTPGWTANCVRHFTEYPECGGYQPGSWVNWGGESQMATPFFDGSQMCGVVTPGNAGKFMECSPSYLGFDQVSPTLLKSAVWTWREGEPAKDGCAALHSDGRWTSESCDQALPNAERFFGEWALAPSSSWGNSTIDAGFQFAVPQSGFEQRQLLDVMRQKNVQKCWIAFKTDSSQ